jgi:quinol monooxygenase YgiN
VLIVAGYFEVDPARRAEFLVSREAAMRRSRSEVGCITYVFSPDPIDPSLVHLFERWESKDALAAHLEAGRSRPPAESPVPVISSEIRQYEIERVGSLGS